MVKAGGRPILKASELSPLPVLFKSTPVSIPKVLLTGRLAEVNRLPAGKEEAGRSEGLMLREKHLERHWEGWTFSGGKERTRI